MTAAKLQSYTARDLGQMAKKHLGKKGFPVHKEAHGYGMEQGLGLTSCSVLRNGRTWTRHLGITWGWSGCKTVTLQ